MIWVVFDYGGVLSYLPTQRDLTMLAAAAGAGPPEFAGAYRRWRRGYDLADVDAAGYWRQVGASLWGVHSVTASGRPRKAGYLNRARCPPVQPSGLGPDEPTKTFTSFIAAPQSRLF